MYGTHFANSAHNWVSIGSGHCARIITLPMVTCMLLHFKTLDLGPYHTLVHASRIAKMLDKNWTGWNARKVAALSSEL